jgi:5-methylcytosine-specific restriction protein A
VQRHEGGIPFEFLGELRPVTDRAGRIVEYSHRLPQGVHPNRYAAGPFCRFALHTDALGAGVYALTVDGVLKYIGRCIDVAERFGPNGYGDIAARNCHSDGQATNCKVNALVLAAAKAGRSIAVWFHRTPRHEAVEADLLGRLRPPWNGRGEGAGQAGRAPNPGASRVTETDFRDALWREFARAEQAGASSVSVRAGDLHRTVGGYPGPVHRMPLCCAVMQSERHPGDRVLHSPPQGAGASLMIEYKIPRRAETA